MDGKCLVLLHDLGYTGHMVWLGLDLGEHLLCTTELLQFLDVKEACIPFSGSLQTEGGTQDARQPPNTARGLVDGNKIEIYLDLLRKALLKRRELKPIKAHLVEVDIHYSWTSPLIVQISHCGKTHRISSLDKGFNLLPTMDLVTPMEL
ncbi:UNVERIFIED_CONTAM: hypothetical protein K2H54_043557 [Gekko kuhli]